MSRFSLRDCLRCCGAASDAIADEGGDGAGHEEEHGASEDEAVGNPFLVEEAGGLGVEGAEETLDATDGAVGIEDAGVAGLPTDETDQKGEGHGEPGPQDGWGLEGFVGFGGEFDAG